MRFKRYGGWILFAVLLLVAILVVGGIVVQNRQAGVPGCETLARNNSLHTHIVKCSLRIEKQLSDNRPRGDEAEFNAHAPDGSPVILRVASMYGDCTSQTLNAEINPGDKVEVLGIKVAPHVISVCNSPASIKVLLPLFDTSY